MTDSRRAVVADDETLVGRAARGDREAAEVLLRRHHEMIRRICHRMTANNADAEDATQLALIAIVGGLRSFDGRSRFTTWMHRVTVNTCLDELRRRARRPVPVAELPDPGPHSSPIDQVVDRTDIQRALRCLSPDFRAAVVLRDLCGLDYDEIASVLELPPGTVRSRIARARAALRDAWAAGTGEAPAIVEGPNHG